MTEVETTEEPALKNYVVKLSLPIEAPSLVAAIETFMDEVGQGWTFRVHTAGGQFLVDTQVVDGKVMEIESLPVKLTNLYYVRGENESGEDLSSIVEAISPDEAAELWKEYWKTTSAENGEMREVLRLPEQTGVSKVFSWFSDEFPTVLQRA